LHGKKDVRLPERYGVLQRTLPSLSNSTERIGASLLASGANCFELSAEDESIESGLRRDAAADDAGALKSLDKLSEAFHAPLRELIKVEKVQ
jgi:hypothetical protein